MVAPVHDIARQLRRLMVVMAPRRRYGETTSPSINPDPIDLSREGVPINVDIAPVNVDIVSVHVDEAAVDGDSALTGGGRIDTNFLTGLFDFELRPHPACLDW